MNLPQFKLMAEVESVNTCNGWGFAGYYGKMFTLDNLRYRQTKWSYRHTKSTTYDGYFVDDSEVTKEVFLLKVHDILFIKPIKKQKKTKKVFVTKNPKVVQVSLF